MHSARVARMAQVSPLFPRPPSASTTFGLPPRVRLELRRGTAPPLTYEVSDLGFLIGSVPGCDLRLPGADLPPVICLVTRHAGGATLRRLVPTQPVLVNGHARANGPLVDGDRVSLGAIEFLVHVVPIQGEQPGSPDSASKQGVESSDLAGREERLARQKQELAGVRARAGGDSPAAV